MKYLIFSGSLRKGSLNKKLMGVIVSLVKEIPEATIEVADIKSLNIPVYDGDIEEKGIPEGVVQLGKMVSSASALITCSPEYNASIAGSFKNVIDWLSRIRPVPLEKKPVLLTGASPGGFGTIRALLASQAPFDTLGAFAFPKTFALQKANEAFTDEGDLVDQKTKSRLKDLLIEFNQYAGRFT